MPTWDQYSPELHSIIDEYRRIRPQLDADDPQLIRLRNQIMPVLFFANPSLYVQPHLRASDNIEEEYDRILRQSEAELADLADHAYFLAEYEYADYNPPTTAGPPAATPPAAATASSDAVDATNNAGFRVPNVSPPPPSPPTTTTTRIDDVEEEEEITTTTQNNNSSSNNNNNNNTSNDNDLCVVCMENQPNHVVIPCCHLLLCEVCSSDENLNKMTRQCPVCRTFIERTLRVYRTSGNINNGLIEQQQR